MNKLEYYVYWHPDNDVPKGTENPFTVSATKNKRLAGREVKQVLKILYPNLKDFIIFDQRGPVELKKDIFDKFKKVGTTDDIEGNK